MTLYSLYSIAFVLQVIVCVGVAAFVFPLWRRQRRYFFLAFGCAALLDIFIAVFDMLSLRSALTDAEQDLLSKALQVIHIISIIIFGSGLALLIRYFRSAETPIRSSSDGGTPSV